MDNQKTQLLSDAADALPRKLTGVSPTPRGEDEEISRAQLDGIQPLKKK